MSNVLLNVADLGLSFEDKVVLSHISFSLSSGERVGLVGPSGGGKSVLLKTLAGIYKPTYGKVDFDPSNKIGFLFQEGGLFDSMNVEQNVAFPLINDGVDIVKALEKSREILNQVGLSGAEKKFPAELSGGMRRRVGIARALINSPKMLMIDDPTGGLDPVASSIILDLLLELQKSTQAAVLIASHDLRRLIPRVDRIISLFNGEVVYDGNKEDLKNQKSGETVKFLQNRIEVENIC